MRVALLGVVLALPAIALAAEPASTLPPFARSLMQQYKTYPKGFASAKDATRHMTPAPAECFGSDRKNRCVPAVIAEDTRPNLTWRAGWAFLKDTVCVDEEHDDFLVGCNDPDAVRENNIVAPVTIRLPSGVEQPVSTEESALLLNLKVRWKAYYPGRVFSTPSEARAHPRRTQWPCHVASGQGACKEVVVEVSNDTGRGWVSSWADPDNIICVDQGTGTFKVDCRDADAVEVEDLMCSNLPIKSPARRCYRLSDQLKRRAIRP